VFAVPGRVDSPASRGTHRLLKGGARLVEDAADIFDEFEFLAPVREAAAPGGAAATAGPRMVFNGPEQAVVEALIEGALDIDTLARQAGLPSQDLSGVLLSLEMKRAVRMLPGRLVELAVTVSRDAAEA
jgi:DNA processing protein